LQPNQALIGNVHAWSYISGLMNSFVLTTKHSVFVPEARIFMPKTECLCARNSFAWVWKAAETILYPCH